MQGLRPLFLLRSRLAPKQASASRLRRRNSLRASGLHHSKKNHENRLARPLSLQTYKTYKAYLSAEGSGPHGQWTSHAKVCIQGFWEGSLSSWFRGIVCLHGLGGDSLFSRFSFASAPRFDAGESAIVGAEGGERRASHKSSAPTMAEGLSPWRWHKGVFLVLVLRLVL